MRTDLPTAQKLSVGILLTGALALHIWHEERPAQRWMSVARQNVARWFYYDIEAKALSDWFLFAQPGEKRSPDSSSIFSEMFYEGIGYARVEGTQVVIGDVVGDSDHLFPPVLSLRRWTYPIDHEMHRRVRFALHSDDLRELAMVMERLKASSDVQQTIKAGEVNESYFEDPRLFLLTYEAYKHEIQLRGLLTELSIQAEPQAAIPRVYSLIARNYETRRVGVPALGLSFPPSLAVVVLAVLAAVSSALLDAVLARVSVRGQAESWVIVDRSTVLGALVSWLFILLLVVAPIATCVAAMTLVSGDPVFARPWHLLACQVSFGIATIAAARAAVRLAMLRWRRGRRRIIESLRRGRLRYRRPTPS